MRYGMFDQIEVDRRSRLHELYRDRLALVRAAEEAGFERYHKSEHHMIRLDAIPQMGLFFAAAAQHTDADPVRLARVPAAVPPPDPPGRGDLLARPPARRALRRRRRAAASASPSTSCGASSPSGRRRTSTRRSAVLRPRSPCDSLTFHGEKYHFDDLPIVLHPYQQPHPPLWYAGNIVPAAAGRMNCIVGGPVPLIAKQVAAYRDACAAAGWEGGTIGGVCSVYVAPTDEEARARVRQAWAVFTEHLVQLFRRWGLDAAQRPDARRRRRPGARARRARGRVAGDRARAPRALRGGERDRLLRRQVRPRRPHPRRADALDRPVRHATSWDR